MKKSFVKDINIFIPTNNTAFISVVSVFVISLIILFLKPDLFFQTFKSVLGNIVLVMLVFGFSYVNIKYGVALALFFIVLSRIIWSCSSTTSTSASSSVLQEGFANSSWPPDLVEKFLKFEAVLNPNIVYDMEVVQQQATPEEVSYLFENNKWPWSEEVQKLYKEAVAQSSFIKVDPGISMLDAQQIYNEMAMKQILSFSTKEGTFLLYGAVIGHSDNMPDNINNVVKCGTDPNTGKAIVEKIVYNGYDSINGNLNKTVTVLNNDQLPAEIPGFNFINSPCNPCSALNSPPEYKCPFTLNTGNGNEVSPVWNMLWNTDPQQQTNGSGVPPPNEGDMAVCDMKTGLDKKTGLKCFPMLFELKNEISKMDFISTIKPITGVSTNSGGSSGSGSSGSGSSSNSIPGTS